MHPYTKIDMLVENLGVTRKTASLYLNQLEELGIMNSLKLGRSKFFVNKKLFQLLQKSV